MKKFDIMKKRVITIGIVVIFLIPIAQSGHALALEPTDEISLNQANDKLLGASTALQSDNPAEYELLWEPNRAKAAVHAIALSPNEKLLAVGGGHISGDNEIHAYYWTGEWTHLWAAGDGVIDGSVLALAIDDIDGDGYYEIIAGSAGGYLYVYSFRTGNPDFAEQRAVEVFQLAWRSSDEIHHRIWSLTIDDLDEDTVKEIIVGAGDGIHVFEYLTRSGYRNALGYTQTYVEVWNSGNFIQLVRTVATGDTDGDGFKEIIAGSEDHRIYVFENTEDVWSAWPPHADNAYELRWDSGKQLLGAVQSLYVGNFNKDSNADEIVASAYGHGVFVFEYSPILANLASSLFIAQATFETSKTGVTAQLYQPSSKALGVSGKQPQQAAQPIAQPIVAQQGQPIVAQPYQPVIVKNIPIQPIAPVKPSQDIVLTELPDGTPTVVITYIKDRTMTMTKLFRPLEPWEAPGAYGGPEANYPVDIYTDLSTGTDGDVKDPYEGEHPITSNTAMAKDPDGILGLIEQDGSVVLDFGKFEKVTGGGNSAPDLNILLGVGPDIIDKPIIRAVKELQPAEPIIPIGQMIPMEVVDPVAPIIQTQPTETMVDSFFDVTVEIPPVGAKNAGSENPLQPDQDRIVKPVLIDYTPVEPILIQPIVTKPVLTQQLLSTRVVANVSIKPIQPVLTTQPFLTPSSPVRTVTEFQPISPALMQAKPAEVGAIQAIQPMVASEAIVAVLRQQSIEVAISQDGQNFTIIPERYIKDAEWTRTSGGERLGEFERAPTEVAVLPSYVIDVDPVLVTLQWDEFQYMYIKNTGNVNIYVDTAYGILSRPPAEVLSIQMGPLNLRRPGTGSYSTAYDDKDLIILGTQDGRLIFYDYQGPQKAPRVFDTYEDSLFSVGTGIWDFVPVTNNDAQRGYLCGTYPAIHWVETNQTQYEGDRYWRAWNVWNNLERLDEWTFNEAVEIADPDGDGHFEVIAGSFDNNIYLFENIYNGTYYDAWSSPDLSHVETGSITLPFVGNLPYGIRLYDDTVDIVVGNTDGDEANEIIVATTRSILIFENRGNEINPNLYELAWRGDFTQDANYEIDALALGDDMDNDGAPEIVVLVGNKVYILEARELYVPPEALVPIQPILNVTNPKLGRIFVEAIATDNLIEQPNKDLVMQPIINPTVQQPIVQPIAQQAVVQPSAQPKTEQKIVATQPVPQQVVYVASPSTPQIALAEPSLERLQPKWELLYNNYIITEEWTWDDEPDLPSFSGIVITRMITEDIDSDGQGEVILSAVVGAKTFNAAILGSYSGAVIGIESVSNDRYQLKWKYTAGARRPITSLAVDDQDGDGLKELYLGTRDIMVYEHTGANDQLAVVREPGTDVGWVGALGVGDSDGDGVRELLVAATNSSESGTDLPRNIISVLEYSGPTFRYALRFNTAFREPINIRDIAVGDTNNNGYDEIICSAPGGFILSYEFATNIEVANDGLFLVGVLVATPYNPGYRTVFVRETTTIQEAKKELVVKANESQLPVVQYVAIGSIGGVQR